MSRGKSSVGRKRKKVLVAFLAGAVAMTAVLGGTLAQYTDLDVSESQELVAGILDIELDNEGITAPFSQHIGSIPRALLASGTQYYSLYSGTHFYVGFAMRYDK